MTYVSLTNFHFSMSNASMPTYRKRKVSAINDKVAKVCLQKKLATEILLA